jgi:hypothetical protein
MSAKAGLWIDREKAVIVFLSGETEKTLMVESQLKNHFRTAGVFNDTRPNGRSEVAPGDIVQRECKEHLNVYYDEVIAQLRKAGTILIFGPGEAKVELLNRIRKNRLEGLVKVVEAVGKMTNRQIVAKVRSYFHKQSNRFALKHVPSHALAQSAYSGT